MPTFGLLCFQRLARLDLSLLERANQRLSEVGESGPEKERK